MELEVVGLYCFLIVWVYRVLKQVMGLNHFKDMAFNR